jgi:hypothetical protein
VRHRPEEADSGPTGRDWMSSMIIVMRNTATEADVEAVVERLAAVG